MWDTMLACKRVLQHFIDERNEAPRCVVCNAVLYDYQSEINSYLYLLEVRDRKIHAGMNQHIICYVFDNYPFDDKYLERHHVNYAKNIQVPTCVSCHHKIHGRKHPELDKWLPVDKKPKKQSGFETNMFKPLS